MQQKKESEYQKRRKLAEQKILDNYIITKNGSVINPDTLKELKPTKDKDGFYKVTCYVNGKTCSKYLHRLIALKHLPNPLNKLYVHHKDGDKTNNDVRNLKWTNAKSRSQWSVNFIKRGEEAPSAKLTKEQVIQIIKSKKSGAELAEMFGVLPGQISQIKNGRSWAHVYNELHAKQDRSTSSIVCSMCDEGFQKCQC